MSSSDDGYEAIFAKVVSVLGSAEAARTRMQERALGQNRQVPVDMLETDEGATLVQTYPEQIEHSVYV